MKRSNGMNRFYKDDNTLNTGQEFTLNQLKNISMNSVHTLEIGGIKKGNKFILQSMGSTNNSGRKFCLLGNGKGETYWHIHPSMNPFWPSIADILKVRSGSIQYVVSMFGYWIIKTNDKYLKGQIDERVIRQYYDLFHNELNKMFSKDSEPFKPEKLRDIILAFMKRIQSYGVDLSFHPWGILKDFDAKYFNLNSY